jgi:hypothetical protein
LIKGAENKQPKIAAGSVCIITECLRCVISFFFFQFSFLFFFFFFVLRIASICSLFSVFGIKTFPTKLLLKVFPKWFEHSNPTMREAAQAFAIELARWLGLEFVQKPYLEHLREAQA